MNSKCKKTNYSDCDIDSTRKVDRVVWSYTDNGNTFKDEEIIEFQKDEKEKTMKKAICIGYNPAQCEKKLDTTNKRLAKMLWEDYDGYTLKNLYTQVTPDAATCDLSLAGNNDSINEIAARIESEEDTIILFWGCTAVVYNMIIGALEKREKKKTSHNGSCFRTMYTKGKNRNGEEIFIHPGSQDGTKLADFVFDKNVKTTNVIR